MGGGGYKTVGGGASFISTKREAGRKQVLTMLKLAGGGGTQSFRVVLTRELEVLAILEDGGANTPFKRHRGMCERFNPVLGGRVQKDSDPQFSHYFCNLPPPHN